MTTNARRQTLAALAHLSDLAPDIRIGQLVAHLGVLSEDDGGLGLGDIEDSDLLKVIDRHRAELEQLASIALDGALQKTGVA